MPDPVPTLVLASTSRHRRSLLERLRCSFETAAPGVDETPLPGEAPAALARRLAVAKATEVAANQGASHRLVIGSDQVADLDGRALGKPGDSATCVAQLMSCSGRRVRFHTGLAIVDSSSGRTESVVELFTVHFRTLSRERITRYVALEQPLDAAGGFYAEGLGISLFEALEGRDPSALIGLPLIALVDLLGAFGFDPLTLAQAGQASAPA